MEGILGSMKKQHFQLKNIITELFFKQKVFLIFLSPVLQRSQKYSGVYYIEKQPLEVFCKKRCSQKFLKTHRKTSVRVSFLIKLQVSILIKLQAEAILMKLQAKKRLQHSCFPVNFAKFPRTPFSQNTSGGCFCIFTNMTSNRMYSLKVKGNPKLNAFVTWSKPCIQQTTNA